MGLCQLTNLWERMNLPAPEQAYRQVCNSPKPWRTHLHPILYWAAYETGPWEMRVLPMSKSLNLFKRNYEIILHKALDGENLDVPIEKALPEKIGVPCSAKQNQANLKNLRAQLRL